MNIIRTLVVGRPNHAVSARSLPVAMRLARISTPSFAVIGLLVMVMAALPAAAATYSLEVKKSDRILFVKNGENVEKTYEIALGRGGNGDKLEVGDNRTPIGTYRIVSFNDNSKFYFFMQLNYPNVKDAFYGLKRNLISRAEFDQIIDALRHGALPPQNTGLGGAIGIHGIGDETRKKLRIHDALDWTEGCIALTNTEIQELRKYVKLGTRVVISE